MERGSPRPPRGFHTPNNRQQPYSMDQRNTVNIPFYRDTSRSGGNGNFGTPQRFQRFPGRGGGGRGGGGFQRFNNNNNYTPRNNRPHQQHSQHRSRDQMDISQFYHPSMIEDPWKDLIGEEKERESPDDNENRNQLI